MAAPKRTPFEIERDRAEISELYLKGATQLAIAEQLGLSRQQIGYDLGKIQQQWRTHTALDLDSHKGQQLAKLDQLEREYWMGWEEKQDRGFLDSILNVIRQRSRLLGLEIPPAVIQHNMLVQRRDSPQVTFVIGKGYQ